MTSTGARQEGIDVSLPAEVDRDRPIATLQVDHIVRFHDFLVPRSDTAQGVELRVYSRRCSNL